MESFIKSVNKLILHDGENILSHKRCMAVHEREQKMVAFADNYTSSFGWNTDSCSPKLVTLSVYLCLVLMW